MKKLSFMLSVVLVVLLILVSCANEALDNTDSGATDSFTDKPATSEIKETDKGTDGDTVTYPSTHEYGVTALSCNEGFGYTEICYKHWKLYIDVTVENKGLQYQYTGSPTDLFGQAELKRDSSADGRECSVKSPPFVNTDDITPRVFDTGEKTVYRYAFEMSKDMPSGIYSIEFPFAGKVLKLDRAVEIRNFIDEPEGAYILRAAETAVVGKDTSFDLKNYTLRMIKHDNGEITVDFEGSSGSFVSYRVELNEKLEVLKIYKGENEVK